MPANPESNLSATQWPPENVQYPAATHDVILELVRSSRLARSHNDQSEALLTKMTVAEAMWRRGLAITDACSALGVANDEVRSWAAGLRTQRHPRELEQQAELWAAMLQQTEPRNRMQAEQVVHADCLASVERFFQGGSTNLTDCCRALLMFHSLIAAALAQAEIRDPSFCFERDTLFDDQDTAYFDTDRQQWRRIRSAAEALSQSAMTSAEAP